MHLFRRKPIGDLLAEGDAAHSLKRALGAGDLIMLGIGAVIGAGIFGAIGTAAAGQVDSAGNVIRHGAGPALVFSFLLLGGACALAGLCYAELASMIPQAGSAYAYAYATLGELVAWIIGWDLILEYAVGNVAVAISWGDYFNTLVRGLGVELPIWLTTGYRTALLSPNPEIHGLLETAPRLLGLPLLVNVPAFAIVMFITWLLLRGVRESARANNIMVVIKLAALALFVVVGATHLNPDNYTPFAPNGFTGIHQGAAIVFFAYIGFDAISTAAEETRNPQRNLPIGILGGLAICTFIYVLIGAVLTGMVPYTELAVADPLAHALQLAGFTGGRVDRRARRRGVDDGRVARVPVRTTPHFLCDGPRRLAPGMGREGSSCPSNSARHDAHHRDRRGSRRAHRRCGRNLRPHQHRNPLRVCDRLRGGARASVYRSRASSAVSVCRLCGLSRCSARRRASSSCRACRGRRGNGSGSGSESVWFCTSPYGYRNSRIRSEPVR